MLFLLIDQKRRMPVAARFASPTLQAGFGNERTAGDCDLFPAGPMNFFGRGNLGEALEISKFFFKVNEIANS
jgi:hypothetical protein